MNIQQLEYIVAVETHKNFVQAAEKCFVTQPTLSTMIQKLEDELDVKIFDRKKHPVAVTDVGEIIIRQAKVILNNVKQLKEIVKEYRGDIEGEIRLGVIPTIAPYLLPIILNEISEKYPLLTLKIEEQNTEQIIQNLKNGLLDLGILATPLKDLEIKEYPIYYERFLVYGNQNLKKSIKKSYLLPKDLDNKDLLLLEEGHCFRDQLIKICSLVDKNENKKNIKFEAGSLETLIHMVDEGYGLTLLPELVLKYLSPEKKKNILEFKDPQPVREISLVAHNYFEREKIITVIKDIISTNVSKHITNTNENIIDIK